MRVSFTHKYKKEEGIIKKCFEILLLAFTLTVIATLLALSRMDSKIEEAKENSKDYVAVFKESELHKVLFDEE